MKHRMHFHYLVLALCLSACSGVATFDDLPEATEIVIVGEDQLFADGESGVFVTVRFDDPLPRNQRVTITTTKGKLFQPPYLPDINGVSTLVQTVNGSEVTALLRPETTVPSENVIVSATIDGFTLSTSTSFLPAHPDDMLLTTDRETLDDSDTEVNIDAEFYRSVGMTSDNIRFVPRATVESRDPSATEELRWSLPDYVVSMSNKVTVPLKITQYAAGYRLRVFLTGENGNGEALEKSVLFRLE